MNIEQAFMVLTLARSAIVVIAGAISVNLMFTIVDSKYEIEKSKKK